LQCVKVHPSNAPEFCSFGYITPPQQSSQGLLSLL
jgi:hypothetical protein